MFAFRQRFFWRHFPVAVFTHDRGAHDFIVDNQLNGFARYGTAAAEYRLSIIGNIAIVNRAGDRADVIFHVTDHRFFRRSQVDDKADRIGRLAGVACRIGDHHHRLVLAFSQWVFRRHCPFTVCTHHRGTHDFIVDDQLNGVARRAVFTAEYRQGVISDVTVIDWANHRTDVIFYVTDHRFFRRSQVNDKADRIGRLAGVACRIGDHHHRLVLAFSQWVFRRHCPFTVCTHHRGTHDFIVDDQLNGVARRAVFTAEYRQGVISGVTVIDWANHRTDVIFHLTNHRFFRRGEIDHEINRIGRFAGVACRIGNDHHRFMFAFRQRFFWRHFPVAVFTHDRGAHDFIVDNQLNGIARVRTTATENRLGVVSGIAVVDRASDRANVILNFADRWFARTCRWRGNNVAVITAVVTATVMANNGADANRRTNRR